MESEYLYDYQRKWDTLVTSDNLPLLIPMKAVGTDKETIKRISKDSLWMDDLKVDGHYSCAYVGFGGKYNCRLFSRVISKETEVFTERTEQLKVIAKVLGELSGGDKFIIPGEVVHRLGKDYVPSVMNGLPETCWRNQQIEGFPVFGAFDMIYCNEWFGDVPLEERKNLLATLLSTRDHKLLMRKLQLSFPTGSDVVTTIASGDDIRKEFHLDLSPEEIWDFALEEGWEGQIYKRRNSLYIPGYISRGKVRIKCSKDWLKRKKKRNFDVIIMGFTDAKEGVSGQFLGMVGAAVFGQYKNGVLTEIGQCSGFDVDTRKDMTDNPEKYIGKVIEVEAQERSSRNDRLRHAQWKGLRDDKTPEECVYDECEA